MAEGTSNEATGPSDLTEQVFAKFKVYLDQKVESLSTTLSSDASGRTKALERQSEGQNLKFPWNKDQYLFNASLEDSLEGITHTLQCGNIDGALVQIESTQTLLKQRQKKVKLADKSEAGWLAVKEYEAEELASNSEDEKRIRKAQASALRKKSKATSQDYRQRNTPTLGPNLFDPDNKQFFRGNYIFLCYTVV